MERPPKKYVCEKCGYFGDTSEHEGCNYLAWTTCEQLYIDQLEAELTSLRASPASVPEGYAIVPVEPTPEMLDCFIGATEARGRFEDMLSAAPTPPVSEDRWQPIETAPKDGTMFLCWVSAERYSQEDGGGSGIGHDVSQIDFCWWRSGPIEMPDAGYFDPACGQIGDAQAVTHWMPLPKVPTMQEDKP